MFVIECLMLCGEHGYFPSFLPFHKKQLVSPDPTYGPPLCCLCRVIYLGLGETNYVSMNGATSPHFLFQEVYEKWM